MKKKIDVKYFVLVLISLVFICFIVPKNSLFGSNIDWVSQHIVIPDYFRKLFYETGDFFPDFALALGAGQNIFNFSYYGLFNPIILFSYLLPFVSMATYLIIINILLYISSGLLMYKWLKRHFNMNISFLASIIFLCASPLLFHFHRHFMFVSYMPFLLLGLMGVENYFEKGEKYLLTISTFLIILISYFYSVPSILVFILYGIYYYLKKQKKILCLDFIKDGFNFLSPIVIGILISSFFLLPTFFTVISGRGGGEEINFFNLFIPTINIGAIVYDHYGMGLTALSVFALLYGIINEKKEERFLSIIICIIICLPFFSYLLNGTLYIRNKVFIPFIPLMIYKIAVFFQGLCDRKVKKIFFLLALLSLLLVFICKFNLKIYYVEALFTLGMIYLFSKGKIKYNKLYLFLIIPVFTLLFVNKIDTFVDKDDYKKAIEFPTAAKKILYEEKDLVRIYHLKEPLYNANKIYTKNYYIDSLYSSIYNKEYNNFYRKVFNNPLAYRNKLVTSQNNNLLYQMYMGGKYLYANKDVIGYRRIEKGFYQNDDVLPLFYVTDHFLNEKTFQKQKYPNTILSLLRNVIVKSESKNEVLNNDFEEEVSYNLKKSHNIKLEKKKNGYKVKATKNNNKLVLKLERLLHNKLVLIDFTLQDEWACKNGDSNIIINGIQNKLTCNSAIYKNQNKHFHYVIAEPNLENIEITFAKGIYNIKDIHVYILDYNKIKDINKMITKVSIDKKSTKGDVIKGSVSLSKDGYFVTSIPYDDGFTVYDNGQKISYEKVNTAFLGFPIKKGKHKIKIEYHAKGADLGKGLSVFGILCFLLICYQEKKLKSEINKS